MLNQFLKKSLFLLCVFGLSLNALSSESEPEFQPWSNIKEQLLKTEIDFVGQESAIEDDYYNLVNYRTGTEDLSKENAIQTFIKGLRSMKLKEGLVKVIEGCLLPGPKETLEESPTTIAPSSKLGDWTIPKNKEFEERLKSIIAASTTLTDSMKARIEKAAKTTFLTATCDMAVAAFKAEDKDPYKNYFLEVMDGLLPESDLYFLFHGTRFPSAIVDERSEDEFDSLVENLQEALNAGEIVFVEAVRILDDILGEKLGRNYLMVPVTAGADLEESDGSIVSDDDSGEWEAFDPTELVDVPVSSKKPEGKKKKKRVKNKGKQRRAQPSARKARPKESQDLVGLQAGQFKDLLKTSMSYDDALKICLESLKENGVHDTRRFMSLVEQIKKETEEAEERPVSPVAAPAAAPAFESPVSSTTISSPSPAPSSVVRLRGSNAGAGGASAVTPRRRLVAVSPEPQSAGGASAAASSAVSVPRDSESSIGDRILQDVKLTNINGEGALRSLLSRSFNEISIDNINGSHITLKHNRTNKKGVFVIPHTPNAQEFAIIRFAIVMQSLYTPQDHTLSRQERIRQARAHIQGLRR